MAMGVGGELMLKTVHNPIIDPHFKKTFTNQFEQIYL